MSDMTVLRVETKWRKPVHLLAIDPSYGLLMYMVWISYCWFFRHLWLKCIQLRRRCTDALREQLRACCWQIAGPVAAIAGLGAICAGSDISG
jgi:hypothetical protein